MLCVDPAVGEHATADHLLLAHLANRATRRTNASADHHQYAGNSERHSSWDSWSIGVISEVLVLIVAQQHERLCLPFIGTIINAHSVSCLHPLLLSSPLGARQQ